MGTKRKTITIEEKVAIIRELEKGTSNVSLCKSLNLSSSTVSMIYKNRERIIEGYEKNRKNVKKLRNSSKVDLDDALFDWCKLQADFNVSVNGAILKIQAEKFAQQLGYTDFICSNGWIDRFKKRYNITNGKMVCPTYQFNGDINLASIESVWPRMRHDYLPKNIFNADEVEISYKLRHEENKQRLTVLCCTNMDGSEKRRLLVVGNSTDPQLFTKLKYQSDVESKMTNAIFEEELHEWNKELQRQNRDVLLIIDDSQYHSQFLNFTNIKLIYLTANSIIQPLEQEFLDNFRFNFRKKFLLECLVGSSKIDDSSKIAKPDVLRILNETWICLNPQIIKNSFVKSKLSDNSVRNCDEIDDNKEDCKDDVVLQELENKFNVIIEVKSAKDDVLPDILNTDEIEDGINIEKIKVECINDEEKRSIGNDDDKNITIESAQRALSILWQFADSNGENVKINEYLRNVQNEITDFHLKKLRDDLFV